MKFILSIFILFSLNSFAEVIPFNLGKKFMIQVQDTQFDVDGSELFEALSLDIIDNASGIESKHFSLFDESKKVFEIRCSKFHQTRSVACTIKIFKSKYSKIDLSKKIVTLMINDQNAVSLGQAFFGNGRVYTDMLKSLSINKNNNQSFNLNYKF